MTFRLPTIRTRTHHGRLIKHARYGKHPYDMTGLFKRAREWTRAHPLPPEWTRAFYEGSDDATTEDMIGLRSRLSSLSQHIEQALDPPHRLRIVED